MHGRDRDSHKFPALQMVRSGKCWRGWSQVEATLPVVIDGVVAGEERLTRIVEALFGPFLPALLVDDAQLTTRGRGSRSAARSSSVVHVQSCWLVADSHDAIGQRFGAQPTCKPPLRGDERGTRVSRFSQSCQVKRVRSRNGRGMAGNRVELVLQL